MKTNFTSERKEKRDLGLFDAVIMGVGGAIGFEIFILLDHANEIAGPSVVSALFFCGVLNIVIMLSYCELCAAIPEVGGEYTYAKAAFGGLYAFLTGWLRWISSVLGSALAALCFAQQLSYLVSALTAMAPMSLAQTLIGFQNFVSVNVSLVATIIVLVMMVISVRGVKEIGPLIVIAFVIALIVFVLSGLRHGLVPTKILPPPTTSGVSKVFAATSYTFIMFLGMRALVAGGPKIKEPGKNVPKAILLSIIVLIVLYCSIAYVVVGVPLGDRAEAPLLNVVAEVIMGKAGTVLLTIAGIIACLSSLSTAIMVQTSIFGGLSRDGYLPKSFLSVSKRFGTSHITIITSSIFTMLFAATGVVSFVGYAAGFASILVFALVNISLMKLRKERPYLKRPFRVPLYPFTPIIGIAIAIILLVSPLILREEGSVIAISFGLLLIVITLMMYHLRMVGYTRLRVAVGGINFGVGAVFLVFLYNVFRSGYMSLISSKAAILPICLLLVAIFNILAGILNFGLNFEIFGRLIRLLKRE